MNILGAFFLGSLITWLVSNKVIDRKSKQLSDSETDKLRYRGFYEMEQSDHGVTFRQLDIARAEITTLHKILDKERKRRKKDGATYHENIAKRKKEYELLDLQFDIVALRYAEANAYIAELKTRVIQ